MILARITIGIEGILVIHCLYDSGPKTIDERD
jgi:hypothetical protein